MQALNPLPTEPGARCKGGSPGPGKHGDGLARKPAPKGDWPPARDQNEQETNIDPEQSLNML